MYTLKSFQANIVLLRKIVHKNGQPLRVFAGNGQNLWVVGGFWLLFKHLNRAHYARPPLLVRTRALLEVCALKFQLATVAPGPHRKF